MIPVSTMATAAFLAGPVTPASGAAPIRITPVGTPPVAPVPAALSSRRTGRSGATKATRGSRWRLPSRSRGSDTTRVLMEPNSESTVAPSVVALPATRKLDGRRLNPFNRREGDVVAVGVAHDGLAGPELLPQDPLRQRVLHQALDGPP